MKTCKRCGGAKELAAVRRPAARRPDGRIIPSRPYRVWVCPACRGTVPWVVPRCRAARRRGRTVEDADPAFENAVRAYEDAG